MPVQINIFILLFGGLQGLLFSLFLFRKKLLPQADALEVFKLADEKFFPLIFPQISQIFTQISQIFTLNC